jgi:voltage-gated potassium channel
MLVSFANQCEATLCPRLHASRVNRPWWRHDVLLLSLGALSIGMVFWYENGNLNANQIRIVFLLDYAFVAYFLADWVAMWREHAWSRRWLGWNAWRLLGMVPVVVTALAFLRLLRLARLVNVLNYVPAFRKGIAALRQNFNATALRPLAIAAASITLGGAMLVWLAERKANVELSQFSEALWWAIVTVTTVGYGDITPITRMGRLVAVGLMLTGIGTIGLLASQVSTAIIRGGPTVASSPSIPSQLAKLAKLHEAGHLSAQEFTAAKRAILQPSEPPKP